MTKIEVQSRLDLFTRPIWSHGDIGQWFGVDLNAAPQSLLAQFRIWAERYERRERDWDRTYVRINRFYFERFLQSRELTPLRSAAVQLGMDEDSFMKMIEAARNENYVTAGEAAGDFPGVFRASLIRDLHTRFPKLQHMTFSSHSSFVGRLHKEIKETLDVEVAPRFCVTCEALGERKDYSHDLDFITDEPMGLGHQIWLDTGKPMQLRPDSCSWVTFVTFEELLKSMVIGPTEKISNEQRETIRKFCER